MFTYFYREIYTGKIVYNNKSFVYRISSIPVKFWDEYYKSLVYSPAFYPVPFLTAQVKESPENSILEEVPMNSERWSSSSALLPYYLHKFTISTDNTGILTPLNYFWFKCRSF